MGICLDTEQSDGSNAFEEGQDTWVQNTPRRIAEAGPQPSSGDLPMQNNTNVQFESPKVPVIFVLGGPGSGKVTHCDSLMQQKKGLVHINMTDLLQQYAMGNDMQDFGALSSRTVTQVLMLEMKMAPNAKTYLVSGFPRNMRDVVEYAEKIQVISGAIMISWRQKVLERQIDYGAKLGQVVLSLAKMELNNFYKNVVPVGDYFDQRNMLIAVNGERHPSDVYKDFREAVFKILGSQDNPPVFSNGRVAGAAAIPADLTTELALPPNVGSPERPKTQVISVGANNHQNYQSPLKGWPPVLWVIGGPGSNKAVLCAQAAKETNWTHISVGKLLRAAADPPDPRHSPDTAKIRDCISAGELVPLDLVMRFVESHMAANVAVNGIILDGFPRDMNQAAEFESRFKQKPTIILLDCSKLQLGRGRLDDSVTAFRRRLEIFRQSSLPMLKAMDNIGRLTIVDGDTETTAVQEDFRNVVQEHIQHLHDATNGRIPNGHVPAEEESDGDEANPIETISNNVSNGIAYTVANGVKNMGNGFVAKANGHVLANGHAMANGHAKPVEDKEAYNAVNFMDGQI